jgi:hypothetical protein
MKPYLGVLLWVGLMSAQNASHWVYFGKDHRLEYRADAHGNRIVDFPYAGYRGGGVRLPNVPRALGLAAVKGDNTVRLQAAIDEVSSRAPDAHGFRGAVALEAGVYEVAGTVTIGAGGVVLRGAGSENGGTTIRLTGAPHRFLEIRGQGAWAAEGNSAAIVDP